MRHVRRLKHARRLRRSISIGLWAGATVVLVAALTRSVLSLDESDWNACGIPPARVGPMLSQVTVVAGCVVAFVLGHLSGHIDPEPPPRVKRAELADKLKQSRTRVQTAVVGLLMLTSVALLVYETVALQNPRSLVAITYYVRCAAVIHNYRTALAALALCFLVGRWFRFPWWSV